MDDLSLPQATLQVPLSGQDTKQTPPPDRPLAASISPSLVALQLQKESQELDIKKLELQLQLAKLQGGQIASPTSAESSPGKSLGDLKAPQKTLHPQPWPHIYAPGEPKLYNDLSMPEFCAGYLVYHPSKRLKIPLRRSSRPFPPTYGFGVCVPVVSSPLLSLQSVAFPRAWFD